MICTDDNHERGAISLNEQNIVRFGHFAWTTTDRPAHPCVRAWCMWGMDNTKTLMSSESELQNTSGGSSPAPRVCIYGLAGVEVDYGSRGHVGWEIGEQAQSQ